MMSRNASHLAGDPNVPLGANPDASKEQGMRLF